MGTEPLRLRNCDKEIIDVVARVDVDHPCQNDRLTTDASSPNFQRSLGRALWRAWGKLARNSTAQTFVFCYQEGHIAADQIAVKAAFICIDGDPAPEVNAVANAAPGR